MKKKLEKNGFISLKDRMKIKNERERDWKTKEGACCDATMRWMEDELRERQKSQFIFAPFNININNMYVGLFKLYS